jgi:hypothetical protein
MDEILKGFDFCFPYIDDILVYSLSPQEYEQRLKTLFKQLQAYGILLNPDKCVFRAAEVSFLGYRISRKGSQTMPDGWPSSRLVHLPRQSVSCDNSWGC